MHKNAIGLAASDITIINSPKSFFQQIEKLVQQATKRIVISALYVQDDEAGRAFLNLLVIKKQQCPNISIDIFVDDHRARRGLIGEKAQLGNQAFYQTVCQKHSIDIAFYGVRVKSRELMGVMHLKGMMFDDVVLYSGASINNIYLQFNDSYRLDRYYTIHSKALADSMCQFLERNLVRTGLVHSLIETTYASKRQLKKLSKSTLHQLRRAHYQSLTNSQSSELTIRPFVGCGKRRNKLNKVTLDLIHQSEFSLTLVTPYFNLPKPMIRALIRALKRGVKVSIIVGDKKANDFFIRDDASFSTIGIVPYLYEQILRRFVGKWQKYIFDGDLTIRLWQDGANSFHAKGMHVDDKIHLITGSNLNPRAWGLDLENGLLIEDEQQLLLSDIELELANIIEKTTTLSNQTDIDAITDYPTQPQKIMKKLSWSAGDRILKRFL